MQDRNSWGSVSQPHTIASMILTTVMGEVGDGIARKGSPILFRHPTQADPFSVLFELHESGKLLTIASLRFSMDGTGRVSAGASIPDLRLPAPRQVDAVDRAWVANIAYAGWEAALAS